MNKPIKRIAGVVSLLPKCTQTQCVVCTQRTQLHFHLLTVILLSPLPFAGTHILVNWSFPESIKEKYRLRRICSFPFWGVGRLWCVWSSVLPLCQMKTDSPSTFITFWQKLTFFRYKFFDYFKGIEKTSVIFSVFYTHKQ